MSGITDLRVLFDGQCGLCSRTVQFLYKREARARFTFTPLQSDLGRQLAAGIGIDPDDPASFAVLDPMGKGYLRSTGAFFALKHCRQPWSVFAIAAGLLPRAMTDFCYDFIAKRRLRFFGAADVCSLQQGGLAERMITSP